MIALLLSGVGTAHARTDVGTSEFLTPERSLGLGLKIVLPLNMLREDRRVEKGGPVRLAQVNFDFTKYGHERGHRSIYKPRVKVYTAPKPHVPFGAKPKIGTTIKPVRPPQPGAHSYIIYGSDGRAYRVYPRGKRVRRRGFNPFDDIRRPVVPRYSGYRTMCVRTCDGFYYPVSNSTWRSRLRRDSNICQSSCVAPAKLFYYSNAGGSIETMVDLRGKRYAKMKYAFKYRKKLVADCQCKEQPWSQSEIIRHEQYAAEEMDRGVKRVKLVRVANVVESSLQVVRKEDGPAVVTPSDRKDEKPEEHNVQVSRAPLKPEDPKGPEGTKETPVGRASDDDEGGEVPTEDTLAEDTQAEDADAEGTELVAADQRSLAKLRQKQRYKMSAQRMKRWWRSNRY